MFVFASWRNHSGLAFKTVAHNAGAASLSAGDGRLWPAIFAGARAPASFQALAVSNLLCMCIWLR